MTYLRWGLHPLVRTTLRAGLWALGLVYGYTMGKSFTSSFSLPFLRWQSSFFKVEDELKRLDPFPDQPLDSPGGVNGCFSIDTMPKDKVPGGL